METILGYMTESERDLYLLEKAHDLSMKRFGFLFESIAEKGLLDMEEAELKVMQESGDFEDLDTLYEASVSETSEKKKGIISRMLSAIGKFIGEVLNKIAKIFNKDLEKKYTDNVSNIPDTKMEKDPKAVFNQLKEKANKCINAITHPGIIKKNEDGTTTVDKKKAAIAAGAGVTVSAATLLAVFKVVKPWLSNIKDVVESQAESNATDNPGVKASAEQLNEVVKEGTTLFNKIATSMAKGVSQIKSGAEEIKDAATSGISKATETAKKLKGQKKEASDEKVATESTSAFGIDLGDDVFMESPNFMEDVDEILDAMESV